MADATHCSMLNLCLPDYKHSWSTNSKCPLLSNCHFSYYCNLVIHVVGLLLKGVLVTTLMLI